MDNTLVELIFAMAPSPADGQGGAGMGMFTCLMSIAFLGIFYALLIRPQQKQQEQHQKMVEDITSGSRVIAAGIVGTITSVKKNTIVVKSADTKIELARNSIERIITDDEDDESSDK